MTATEVVHPKTTSDSLAGLAADIQHMKAEMLGLRKSLVLLVSFMVEHIGLEDAVLTRFGSPASDDLKNLAALDTDGIEPIEGELPTITSSEIEGILSRLIADEIVSVVPEVIPSTNEPYHDLLNQATNQLLDYQMALTSVNIVDMPEDVIRASESTVILLGQLETAPGLSFKTVRRINGYLDMVLGANKSELVSEG